VNLDQAQPPIIYENEYYFALNKPANWHSLGLPPPGEQSVEIWLKDSRPAQAGLPEAGIVHRLDFLTTGCLLVAKSANIYQDLRKSFQVSAKEAQSVYSSQATSVITVDKTYLALVRSGLSDSGQFELAFESRYKRSQKVSVSRTGASETKGRCQWRKVGVWEAGDAIEVKLIGAGKRHQIRAGLSFLGADIVGDPLYGMADERGLGLHAWKLKLSGQPESIEAPPPDSWKRFGVQI